MTRPRVTVIARITARPGMEAGVLAELKKLLNWAGEKHLAAHLESRHVKECFERCAGMLAGPPEITRWRQVG